jgi:hypothetical protein
VVVSDHIWLKFEPVRPGPSEDCTTYAFQSSALFDNATRTWSQIGLLEPYEKAIANVSDPAAAAQAFENGYYVGVISGFDLLDAIDTFNGEYGGEYDIITRNCASKVLDVAIYLGFQDVATNATFQAWMTQSLNSPWVINALRNSSNVDLLYPETPREEILAKADDELLGTLVSWYVDREIAAYAEVLEFMRAQDAPAATPTSGVANTALNIASTILVVVAAGLAGWMW